jgi:hypothetical protein
MMDREDAWLRAALQEASPEVDETDVMEAVVKKGRSIRRRRRVYRTVASVAVVVIVI